MLDKTFVPICRIQIILEKLGYSQEVILKQVVYVEAYPAPETSNFLKGNGVTVEPFTGFTARAFFRVFPKVN